MNIYSESLNETKTDVAFTNHKIKDMETFEDLSKHRIFKMVAFHDKAN